MATEGPPVRAGRDTARRVIPLFRPYRLTARAQVATMDGTPVASG